MMNIYELKNEGLMSARLYNALIRGINFDDKFKVKGNYRWEINYANGYELTPKDIMELWSEEELSNWRGMGQGCLEELKSLI